MILKKIVLSQFIIISFIKFSFAQSNFIDGYAVTTKGDTIKGFINEKPLRRKSLVSFKKDKDDRETEMFYPWQLQIVFLRPYDEYYISKILEVDKKPTDDGSLESDPNPKITLDTVLLKVLVKGKINLYFYRDENKKDHFFTQKDQNKIEELLFIKYLIKNKSLTREIYKSQLEELMSDCGDTKKAYVNFTSVSLKKLIEKYNQCKGETSTYKQKDDQLLKKPYSLAGANVSKLTYSGGDISNYSGDYPSKSNYTNSSSPVLGLGLNLSSKRSALSLDLELLFSQSHFKGSYTTSIYYVETEFKFTYARFNYMAKYTSKSNNPHFARLGLTTGLSFNETNSLIISRPALSDKLYSGKAANFNKIDLGLVSGVGKQLKNWGIECRYELIFKSDSKNARLITNSLYLLLTYRF